MKPLFRIILAGAVLLTSAPAIADPPGQTTYPDRTVTRVPMCLQFPDTKTYVPCTGVVPVDKTTGQPLDWSTILKGTPSSPTYTTPVENGNPITPTNPLDVLANGKDSGGVVRPLTTGTNGNLVVTCANCSGGTGGTAGSTNSDGALNVAETSKRLHWSETISPLAANASFTGQSRDDGGTLAGGVSRWSIFACYAFSDQTGTLYLEASNNGSTWVIVQTKALTGVLQSIYLSQPLFTRFWRCRVVNDGSAQGTFMLNSAFGS